MELKIKELNLGCGNLKKNGFIGVDILDLPSVDIKHDLSEFPYPFKNNEISEVWMDQVLEHIENPLTVIEEIYRICCNHAKVTIGVPYFRSHYAVIDPTHKNFFSVNWFQYFNPSSPFFKRYGYSKAMFKILKIEFDREFTDKSGFPYRLIRWLANKKPEFYEMKLSHLYPLNSLTYYLEVLKE